MNYPLRLISIRVPWHDTGWDGRVCATPRLDGSCLKIQDHFNQTALLDCFAEHLKREQSLCFFTPSRCRSWRMRPAAAS
jgi:hypothetical protein